MRKVWKNEKMTCFQRFSNLVFVFVHKFCETLYIVIYYYTLPLLLIVLIMAWKIIGDNWFDAGDSTTCPDAEATPSDYDWTEALSFNLVPLIQDAINNPPPPAATEKSKTDFLKMVTEIYFELPTGML